MERNTVRPVDKDTIDHVIDADGGHQTHDDAANACYTAAGYNFRRFLAGLPSFGMSARRRLAGRPRAPRRPLTLTPIF